MAGKVNTRFVLGLSAVMVLVAGAVVATAFFVIMKSGEDLAREGDRNYAAGEYRLASIMYARAVGKDQTRTDWLNKWRDALSKRPMISQTEYEQTFQRIAGGIMRQVALNESDRDIAPTHEYLSTMWEQLRESPGASQSLTFLADETSAFLKEYEAVPTSAPPGWESLRRYRGLATLLRMQSGSSVKEEEIALTKDDLEAALRSNPADEEVAIGLEQWAYVQAIAAEQRDEKDKAAELVAQGKAAVEAYLTENPNSPQAELSRIRWALEAERKRIFETVPSDQWNAQWRLVLDGLKPRMAAVALDLSSRPPAEVRPRVIGLFQGLDMRIDGASRLKLTQEILREHLAKAPDDADKQYMLGIALGQTGERDAAVIELQKLREMKAKPVSLDGLRLMNYQTMAAERQARYTLEQWDGRDEKQRDAVLARAGAYRDDFAKNVPDDNAALLLLDAQIKFAKGEIPEAARLAARYNERSGASADGLWLAAQIAVRMGQPGRASETLKELLGHDPTNMNARRLLAGVYTQLRDYRAAKALYKEILSFDPGDENALAGLANAEVLLNERPSDDPVIRVLLEAKALADKGEDDAAFTVLEKHLADTNYDHRIVHPLVMHYLQAGKQPEALALITTAKKAHPESRELAMIELQVTQTDSIEARIGIIEMQTDLPDLEKAVEKHLVYRAAERKDDAARELAKAAAIAPEDARVVEFQFIDALQRDDIKEATRLAELAKSKNLDNVDGLTFQARVLIRQTKLVEAIALLQQASKYGAASPEIVRLLGRAEQARGNSNEAIAAFREALAMRPNDVESIIDCMAAMAAAGQTSDALKVGRDGEKYCRNSLKFLNMWLTLKAQVGDEDLALLERHRMLTADPKNRAARVAIAELYLEAQKMVEARKAIDELRASADGSDAIMLDARWHANQGDVAEGRRAFRDAIDRMDQATITIEPYLAFARFLLLYNQVDQAVALLDKEGRAHQSPKKMEADRMLAEVLAQLNQPAAAIEPLTRIVEGGNDDENLRYGMLLVEMLTRMERFDDAGSRLAAVESRRAVDPAYLLLAAQIEAGRGNETKRRELLDRAVNDFPNDPQVYLRRAESMFSKPEMAAEAMADLEAALKLRPSYWPALKTRGDFHSTQGRRDEAIRDYTEVIRLNPAYDELRVPLMHELIRLKRDGEAAQLADTAVAARPSDIRMIVTTGDIFAQHGLWDRAAVFYRIAYERNKNVATALSLLNGLLNGDRPNLGEADTVMAAMQDRISTQPGLLMARAKMYSRRSRVEEARRDIIAALRQVKTDQPDLMQGWFVDLGRVTPDDATTLALLTQIEKDAPDPNWIKYFRASLMIGQPAARAEGLRLMEEVAASTSDETLKHFRHRLRGNGMYADGKYSEAAEAYLEGCKNRPTDWEMANNYAYTVAKHLGKPAEALPYAQKAVDIAPARAEVWDTLGAVYMLSNDLEKAASAFTRALELAEGAVSRAQSHAHLGLVEAARGNAAAAKANYDEASALAEVDPKVMRTVEKDLQDLRAKLGSP